MYIDTHSHLFDSAFDLDRDLVIKECFNQNVGKLIVVGFDKETNKLALELCSKYANLYPTVGLHPTELSDYSDNFFVYLEDLIKDEKIVGIGECGLDYYWDDSKKDLQKEVFKKQIELSLKYDKPLIIHSRDAIADTLEVLKSVNKPIKGVMHGYSGSLEMAKEFVKLGLKLGIGGVLTFKNAKNVKEVVKELDLSNFVLETDCPYLTPTPYRGKRNAPYYIPLIAKEMADIKGIDIKEVEETTTKNANELFGGRLL
ncbi:MAG: TatD family hydrolase [Acholeplasmatales bacterium]|nr:TatD family hydrolase [Acholeplasmatales bacterium]